MTVVERPTVVDTQPRATTPVAKRRRRTPPTAPPPPWQRMVTVGLVILAGLAAWLVLFLGALSGLKQAHAQSQLYAEFRNQLATFTPPPPPFGPHNVLHEGDPVAVISAPTIGLHNEVVVEGTRSGDLENGPGHWPGTPLPGEAGASYLLGRAFAYGGPFGSIGDLQPGAPITVTTGQGTYHFLVVKAVAAGQPIPAAAAASGSVLVLTTAANESWRNLWVPSHPLYVYAALQGKPAPDVTTTLAVPADKPMSSDTSGLTTLVLWLQLLLIVIVAATWAVARWGVRQSWLIGIPVMLAVLWGASLQFTQLLPNLL